MNSRDPVRNHDMLSVSSKKLKSVPASPPIPHQSIGTFLPRKKKHWYGLYDYLGTRRNVTFKVISWKQC